MCTQWDHRNTDSHGCTKEESHVIKHMRLKNQVDAQYAQGPSILAADRDIIAKPILLKAKRSPPALELWLRRKVPIVTLGTTAASQHYRRHQNSQEDH